MDDRDKRDFKDLFDSVCEYYGQNKPSRNNLALYFNILQPYPLNSVRQAFQEHMSDTSEGQFFPRAANLLKFLKGVDLKEDDIIAAARLAQTPLGIKARIHIGSWDLNNADGFYLRSRATEILQLLPQWKAEAMAGEYSNHEISIMLKHGVNPGQPFAHGLPAPTNTQELALRIEQVKQSPRHAQLLEPPHEENDKTLTLPSPIKARLEQTLFGDDDDKMHEQAQCNELQQQGLEDGSSQNKKSLSQHNKQAEQMRVRRKQGDTDVQGMPQSQPGQSQDCGRGAK